MNEITFTLSLIMTEVIFALMLLIALNNAGAKKKMLVVIAMILAAWLTTDYSLISRGFFSATGMPQLAFTAGVIIPIVLMFFAIYAFKPLRRVVENISTETFLRLQIMRSVFGALFFFTAALPIWFQLLGGLGDIAAGIGAFLALNYLHNNPDKEHGAIIRGNFIGILDFIVVINFGVLVVLKTDSPDIMFNLIPLFVVPLFILFHVFSLKRLNKREWELIHD